MWWLGLLFSYLACFAVNWRAGLVFLVGLGACQGILLLKPENTTLYIFSAYSAIGVLTFLFLDKTAGAFICLAGVIYGISLIDLMGGRARKVTAEVVFYLGALACGLGGPTGGFRGDITDQIDLGRAPAYISRLTRIVLRYQRAPRGGLVADK